MRRYPMKRDVSEPSIVEVLEGGGWQTWPIFICNGPDLIACKGRRVAFIECKTGREKLTGGQQQFHAEWEGPPIIVLRSVEEAQMFLRINR